jgi:hypothetical protein
MHKFRKDGQPDVKKRRIAHHGPLNKFHTLRYTARQLITRANAGKVSLTTGCIVAIKWRHGSSQLSIFFSIHLHFYHTPAATERNDQSRKFKRLMKKRAAGFFDTTPVFY